MELTRDEALIACAVKAFCPVIPWPDAQQSAKDALHGWSACHSQPPEIRAALRPTREGADEKQNCPGREHHWINRPDGSAVCSLCLAGHPRRIEVLKNQVAALESKLAETTARAEKAEDKAKGSELVAIKVGDYFYGKDEIACVIGQRNQLLERINEAESKLEVCRKELHTTTRVREERFQEEALRRAGQLIQRWTELGQAAHHFERLGWVEQSRIRKLERVVDDRNRTIESQAKTLAALQSDAAEARKSRDQSSEATVKFAQNLAETERQLNVETVRADAAERALAEVKAQIDAVRGALGA